MSKRIVRLRKRDKGAPCGYCFSTWATGYDHIIPVAYDGLNNSASNLYPCCKRCNSILKDLVFGSLNEKREYIRERLIEVGKWNVSSMREDVHEAAESSKVLLTSLSMGCVGCGESKKICKRCGIEFRHIDRKNYARNYCTVKCRSAAYREQISARTKGTL